MNKRVACAGGVALVAVAAPASAAGAGYAEIGPTANHRSTSENTVQRQGNPYQTLNTAASLVNPQGRAQSRADCLDGGFDLAQVDGSEAPVQLAPLEVTSELPGPRAPLMQPTQNEVVTGREKDRQEAATLGGTLDHLPGVDNVSAGSQVGKPVIRGLSGNRVRILSNGLGIDHQQFGTRHSPNIDPFLSDWIEVMQGASSILYGANALGGVVNVKPLSIRFTPEGEQRQYAETLTRFASNNNQWDAGLRAGAASAQFAFAGGFVRRSGGNITTPEEPTFFPPPPSDPARRDAPAHTGELDFTDFDQLNAAIGAGVQGSWGDLSVRYTRWRNEHNFLLPPPAGQQSPGVAEGIGQDLDDDRLQLEAEIPLATHWQLNPKFMWQNNRRRSNAAGNPRSELFDGTIEVEFDQYTVRLEAEHGRLLGLDRGTLGAQFVHRDQVSRGTTQLAPGGEVTNVGVFAFEERELGALLLQGGLRYDHREIIADEEETASADLIFSGRRREAYNGVSGSLGAAYRFTPNLTLAANAKRGIRAPTLFELFANGIHGGVAAVQIGNPELDLERSINTSLSLRWRSQHLQTTATVYRNQIEDYIFLFDTGEMDPNSGLPIFRHAQADALLTGIELQVSGQPANWLELSATANIVNGENRETSKDLPLLPAKKLRFGIRLLPGGWGRIANPSMRLGVHHAFAKGAAPGEPFSQFDAAPFGTASTAGYTVLDLATGFDWNGLTNRPVRLDLEVRNLLDTAYRDFLDTYKGYALSPGRNIRVTLRVPIGGEPGASLSKRAVR